MLGYIKTIDDFRSEAIDTIVNSLIGMYPESSDSQRVSWKNLIDDIKASSSFSKLDGNLIIGIEYLLPADQMGIDLLICGSEKDHGDIVYLMESKQWNDIYISETEFSNYREDERVLYPQTQVYRHKIGLKNYLDIGAHIVDIRPYVVISHASLVGLQKAKNNGDPIIAPIPLFNSINSFFSEVLKCSLQKPSLTAKDFVEATYLPSKDIINAMESIINREEPFVLTPEQEEATVTIITALNDDKRVVRITGAAGSGKTAILLNLYIKLLNQMGSTGYKPYFISGAQNTYLYRNLYPGVEKSFSFSFAVQKIRPEDARKTIVLMDEAQHNKSGIMTRLLENGARLVLCYDTGQTINANNSLAELSSFESRNDFIQIDLKNSVRFNGSNVFEKNVSRLLNGSLEFENDSKYLFKVFDAPEKLRSAVYELIKTHPNDSVAVLGLLSSDASEIADAFDGSIFVRWGYKGECEWIPYIRRKNYLNENEGKLWVGTWWMPGLDVDYNVVIVGGDAKWTKGGIIGVPEKAKHFKMMSSIGEDLAIPMAGVKDFEKVPSMLDYLNQPGREVQKAEFQRRFNELVRNNYYIMMTRGRKGCFVLFFDKEK